jgi:glyoxylase-like metal-dependent hydrolase (beta-lactamase superfamily II)
MKINAVRRKWPAGLLLAFILVGAAGGQDRPRSLVFTARVAEHAVEVLPGVYASTSVSTVYVIRCGERYVMVDTGMLRDVDAHLANFQAVGVDLKRIDAIFVTHFHYDHVSGIAHAKEKLGCRVVAHRENVQAIETGDPVSTAAQMAYIPDYAFPFPPCKVDIVVEDGDTLRVGSTDFLVCHLPGHTAGDTGYFWEGKLTVGDILYKGGGTGWSDVHWGSNFNDLIDSMNRIRKLSPEYCLPGHGLPWKYEPGESDKVIEYAQGKLKEGSPILFTRRCAGTREREPRRITIP